MLTKNTGQWQCVMTLIKPLRITRMWKEQEGASTPFKDVKT